MDEFDRAIMEALNESVPVAEFSTDLVGRLVARTRRRSRFWRLLLALGLVSAATAAVMTASTILMDSETPPLETDKIQEAAYETPHIADTTSRHNDSTTNMAEANLPENHETQGESKVNNPVLKTAAVLTGTLALSAAAPTRADGYQFIVSGYPTADPCHSSVSGGTSLAAGMLADTSAADTLEARSRTSGNSAGIALRFDKYRGIMLILR